MMKTGTMTILAALMATAMMVPAGASAQEEVKKVNQDTRIVVFPFDGVNVSPNMLAASSEILTSSMVGAGFVVASWKKGLGTVQERAAQPAVAPPAAPPSTVEEAPYAEPVPAAPVDEFAGEGEAVAVAQPVGPAVPPPPMFHPMPVELTDELKSEITTALDCAFYVDGKMIRLGSKIRVSINMKSADGDAVKNEQMEALTEDDLTIIFERVSLAFVTDTTAKETLTMDNATAKESLEIPNKARVVAHHGVMVGGAGVFEVDGEGDANRGLVTFGYQGLLEIKEMRIGMNAGFAFSGSERMALMAGFSGYGYLTHSPVAPYLGAGAGIFLGSLVGPVGSDSESAFDNENNDSSSTNVGFDFFPALGMEFLRQAKIRMSMEMRYMLYVNVDSDFGHGPMGMMSIAF